MVLHMIAALRAMLGLGLLAAVWLAFAAPQAMGASHALGASQEIERPHIVVILSLIHISEPTRPY